MKLPYVVLIFTFTFPVFANQVDALAKMSGRSGKSVEGKIEFAQNADGVTVSYDLQRLPENKTLGLHIHEKGDCSAADAKSAGDHFAKVGEKGTGTSTDFPEKYAGDLPSIASDKNGKAKGSFTIAGLSINQANGIRDRAIVLHGGPDDVTKKSAPRIACGVIQTVK